MPGADALVGGTTAIQLDTQTTSQRDRNVIIPTVLLVVFAILALLMRALLGTVVLSFTATLGISALVFNHVFDFPGADPVVPLFGFVFLVALGVDYNIFLMTRVREESRKHGTREGVRRGLAVTGGVITSAGLVLSATFGALAVIPLIFLAQIAFIVAFGVLLDTLIVRSLLVPALTLQIGRKVVAQCFGAREFADPLADGAAGEVSALSPHGAVAERVRYRMRGWNEPDRNLCETRLELIPTGRPSLTAHGTRDSWTDPSPHVS